MQKQMSESFSEALPISVVIPTYNRAHLVARAIESALAQTKRPSEVIIVDDGSQDDTQQQVAIFAGQARYLRQQNSGAAVARHTGIQAATSKWVAFLDSDDYWERDHLKRMERAIIATKGQGHFYFSDIMTHSHAGSESYWIRRGFAISGEFEFRADATEWVMRRGQPMLLQACVFNREAYFASGGFWAPLRNREDTHMFYKLGLGGPACAVAGIGTHMTADDAPENRLTLTLTSKQGHLYRVMMFNELLTRDIAAEPRQQLRRRLAMTHYRLARLYMRDGGWKTAVSHLWRSLRIDPMVSPRDIIRKVIRSLSSTPAQRDDFSQLRG